MRLLSSTLGASVLAIALYACSGDNITPSTGDATSWEINSGRFNALMQQTAGDPYVIKKAVVTDSLLTVTVQYGGGCERHEFELVWDGAIDSGSIPAKVTFALVHDGNNDMCEALLTEDITFDLVAIMEGNRPIEGFEPYIVNASTGETTMAIPESLDCGWAVKVTSAVCGTGLWDNLWFETLRTEQNGGVRPFLLQPVRVAEGIEIPETVEEGQRFYIGAKILDDYEPDPGVVTCLADPGPHYSIEITCLQPYE